MSSIGWKYGWDENFQLSIGAGFQTGVYKSSQSPTERFNKFKRLLFQIKPAKRFKPLNQRSELNH
jgi:hypothetical protein